MKRIDEYEKAVCPACKKVIKVGINFCNKCGADLSDLDLKIITTEVPTMVASTRVDPTQLESIDKEWANLKQFVEEKNRGEMIKILANYITRLTQIDEASRKKIYDLIGKVLSEDPQFFKLKLFKTFYKKTQNFLAPHLRIEMEKYLMKKYWFFKGETLIISSKGSVIFNKNYNEIRGRFNITNLRIIALGKHLEGTKRTAAGYGIIEFPYMGGIRIWRSLGSVDRVFPYNIKTKKFSVSRVSIKLEQIKKEKEARIDYILKHEYKHKGKTKSITDKLRFVPLQEEGESKVNFQNRRELVFSKITEFLNSTIK